MASHGEWTRLRFIPAQAACAPFRLRIFRGAIAAMAMLAASALPAGEPLPNGWWPTQVVPRGLVSTTRQADWSSHEDEGPLRMLVQSVSGLAAKAVNAGTGDELVWIATGNVDNEEWGRRFRAKHPQVAVRATLEPWALVERFAGRGIIKGYILYHFDRSPSVGTGKLRPGMDLSANVATSVAGLLDGVMIDESLEAEAKRRGLPLLLDVRDKSQQWCFDTFKDRFNRRMLLAMDPKMAAPRDYAIAHQALAVFTHDEPVPSALAWLQPPAAILGWIGGDEFKATRLATIHGHFQTATSLCLNLPVLMAGAHEEASPRLPQMDPRTIAWGDKRNTVSLFTSDGDNVLFFSNGFFRNSPYFWSSPARGKIPFAWSAPLAHLVQLCPQPLEYAVETRTPNDWLVEWHGGYYYPDLFASERPNRWELLATHARRTWAMMQRSGANLIGCNLRYYDRPDALKAYETIIGETDGLLALLVFQYSPYNAGAGRVFWFKDKRGVDTPVITLRYQIWWNLNRRANTGTPAKIAREIREAAEVPGAGPRHEWGMIHVWSYFKSAPGSDEDAENFPPKKEMSGNASYEKLGGDRGLTPATWMTERLPDSVRVVAPEELAWRVRMQHDPVATQKLIEAWK